VVCVKHDPMRRSYHGGKERVPLISGSEMDKEDRIQEGKIFFYFFFGVASLPVVVLVGGRVFFCCCWKYKYPVNHVSTGKNSNVATCLFSDITHKSRVSCRIYRASHVLLGHYQASCRFYLFFFCRRSWKFFIAMLSACRFLLRLNLPYVSSASDVD